MKKIMFANPTGYEFTEFLGEGLNSCVYKAIKQNHEHGLRFEVALKILKSEKLVSLWRNEFDRLAAIESKHCVRLLGWEIFNDKPTLVLEYVDGVTLEDLTVYSHLSADQIQEIYRQALEGLRDLMAAGISHGDLNFNNIMVDKNGLVKLVDFGVRGGHNEMFATPKYAAPEVLMGQEPDFSTDVSSLRMIIAECFERFDLPTVDYEVEDNNNIKAVQRRAELAAKVQYIQRFKGSRHGLTQNITQLKNTKNLPRRTTLRFAIVFLVIWPFFMYGDQSQSEESARYIRVIVRTQNWLQFRINEGPVVFSPNEVLVRVGKKNRIEWRSATSRGDRNLTVQHNQPILLLEDSFFGANK